MKTMRFSIIINAPRDKVWDTMFSKETYEIWSKAFNKDSHFEGGWDRGSTIRFFGTDEYGYQGGMVSEVEESKKPEFLSLKHVAEIINGTEKKGEWSGAHENYTFLEVQDGTELVVNADAEEKFESFFNDVWPQALSTLKELSEK
jgi:uncharacterized protein YndB with AHSA1/START domain